MTDLGIRDNPVGEEVGTTLTESFLGAPSQHFLEC